ncbi:hypothetical protein A3K64_02035 [Candidatus Micrarchaeota archaeon RBG_16_36_9]|nr:MAG: hypothetical protein A3K64_02035 [Candidatus Micrarchaeota archaeon RBG_16_36_9]
MSQPIVNGGIHGHLNYKPEAIDEIEKDLEELKAKHPIVSIEVYLAGTTDKRWNNYVKKEK